MDDLSIHHLFDIYAFHLFSVGSEGEGTTGLKPRSLHFVSKISHY